MKIKIYISVTLLLVLYGCETWYLMLKDILKLRVLEKRVLRRINGGKR
jgi:fumarate reductase subunit C